MLNILPQGTLLFPRAFAFILFYFVFSPDLRRSVAMHVLVLMKPSTLCVAQMEWSSALPVMQDVRQKFPMKRKVG